MCLNPDDDECFTTSDFSKNDDDVDYCEECFTLLSDAQERCHLGTILFEPDCFVLLSNVPGRCNLGTIRHESD